MKADNKLIIGVRESINLNDINLPALHTRIDTGAKTSSLHVDHITADEAEKTVTFECHPTHHGIEETIQCEAAIHDIRWVKSSNGEKQRRYVIKTMASLGDILWEIELTLADRSSMRHLMLLGREALQGRFLVDPEREFMVSKVDID